MASLSISTHLDTPEQGGCRPQAVIASSAHRDVFDHVMKAMSRNSPIHEFYGHSQKLYQVCSVDSCISYNDLVCDLSNVNCCWMRIFVHNKYHLCSISCVNIFLISRKMNFFQ
jgi:hypothetical protein